MNFTLGVRNVVMLHIVLLTAGITTGNVGWFIAATVLASISIVAAAFDVSKNKRR